MKQFMQGFGLSIAVSLVAFGLVFGFLGTGAGLVALILAMIELAFSFDNAVINAKVLTHLNSFWRSLFLSLGIIIAIFGVRALLPVLIVGLTAHLPLGAVADLALHHPSDYARELLLARPGITAFGGAFLLVLSLQFFMAERDVRWLQTIEEPLGRLRNWWIPMLVALVAVGIVALLPGNHHRSVAFIAGLAGVGLFALMHGLIALLNKLFAADTGSEQRVGGAALATFIYLEVLDASLSFDGVIGAFAITSDVVLIAVGLGVGAIWVRSLTVYMVRNRTLDAYRYLEHGAHYAIFVLALSMLLAAVVEVPDFVTGATSLGLIAAAIITSRQVIVDKA